MRNHTWMGALVFALAFLAGCSDEARRNVRLRNCIEGVTSPEYAEVLKACADVAIRLREEARQKQKTKEST